MRYYLGPYLCHRCPHSSPTYKYHRTFATNQKPHSRGGRGANQSVTVCGSRADALPRQHLTATQAGRETRRSKCQRAPD